MTKTRHFIRGAHLSLITKTLLMSGASGGQVEGRKERKKKKDPGRNDAVASIGHAFPSSLSVQPNYRDTDSSSCLTSHVYLRETQVHWAVCFDLRIFLPAPALLAFGSYTRLDLLFFFPFFLFSTCRKKKEKKKPATG